MTAEAADVRLAADRGDAHAALDALLDIAGADNVQDVAILLSRIAGLRKGLAEAAANARKLQRELDEQWSQLDALLIGPDEVQP